MPLDRTRPSLAVLYFASPDGDGRAAPIACGIAEDVMSRLWEVSGLAVASRHEVVALRGRQVEAADLGVCTGVEWVVYGRVDAPEGAVKIELRLVDTGNRGDVWQETYERPDREISGLAPAIARGVTRALVVALSSSEEQRVSKRLTDVPRAYERHAAGRELLTFRGRKHTEAAIQAFEDAVAADADFAVAHESLAAACSGMYTYYDGSKEWLDRMVASARRALEFDGFLIEARFHLAVGALHRREYDRARAGFEEIIRMRPAYYEPYLWLGILFYMTGEHDAALEFYHKGAEIKPCSVEPWLYINMTHRRRGDVPAATDAARKFLEVGLKTLQLVPDEPVTLSRFCVVYTLFDQKDKARETLQRILRTGTEDGLVLYNCAATYALLEDEAGCLECLRRALSGGYKNVRDWIGTDPDFDLVRGTKGFGSLLLEFDRRFGANG